MRSCCLFGISTCFQVVSQAIGQVAHVLLTHPPLALLTSYRSIPLRLLARLACIRHAASVRPEPGSNSRIILCLSAFLLICLLAFALLVVLSLISHKRPLHIGSFALFSFQRSTITLQQLLYLITFSLGCQLFFKSFFNLAYRLV